MSTLIVSLIVLALVFFALLLLRKKRAVPTPSGDKSARERRLLQRCFGDRHMAERLIEHELGTRQGLSRARAVDYAAASLLRDNR